MAENKTKQTELSVDDFIDRIEDEAKRNDCKTLISIMKKITKAPPKMWGDNVIGFGNIHYKYASGREGDWFITGFSPRKQNISIYLLYGFENNKELMKKLGKYKTGKACLYINKIQDIDLNVLEQLIKVNVDKSKAIHKN